MQRTKPPFRADMVGSLLRPEPLKEARARRVAGELSAAALAEVEDREIAKILARQEEVGLQSATDGEFRRSWWHFDFYGMLDNVEIYELDHGIQFQGVQTKPRSIKVVGKIGFSAVHIIPFYHHEYFTSIPGLRSLDDALSAWARRRDIRALSSYAYTIAIK